MFILFVVKECLDGLKGAPKGNWRDINKGDLGEVSPHHSNHLKKHYELRKAQNLNRVRSLKRREGYGLFVLERGRV